MSIRIENYHNHNNHRIEHIASILNTEQAIVNTYSKLEKIFFNDPLVFRLTQFKLNHAEAILFWKSYLKHNENLISNPEHEIFHLTKYIKLEKKLSQNKTLFLKLKNIELHCKKKYTSFLKSNAITEQLRHTISSIYAPRQKRHLKILNSLTTVTK